VVAKSLGTSNPYNMVRATFDALKHQDSPRSVAQRAQHQGVDAKSLRAAKARRSRRTGDGMKQARHEAEEKKP
jgi:hypothetical protein